MYVCNGYNLFTYLVTLHAENLNKRFSFLYTQHPVAALLQSLSK